MTTLAAAPRQQDLMKSCALLALVELQAGFCPKPGVNGMAVITFFTETGFPHAATHWEADNGNEWRIPWWGFNVGAGSGTFVVPGHIQHVSRRSIVNFYTRFKTTDHDLLLLERYIRRVWSGRSYIGLVQDCVSFAADVAYRMSLPTPTVNMTPFGLVSTLAMYTDATLGRRNPASPFPPKGGNDIGSMRHFYTNTSQKPFRGVDRMHTVVEGETLWQLALHYYGDTSKSVRIHDQNRDRIEPSGYLRTGIKLRIPKTPYYIPGKLGPEKVRETSTKFESQMVPH